jgi:bifunctional aspartokinase / homoserine dehydrogenase 1
MKVLKFGGSSIDTFDKLNRAKDIVSKDRLPVIIVVSAFHGITDLLEEAISQAAGHNDTYKNIIDEIETQYSTVARELSLTTGNDKVLTTIHNLIQEVKVLLDEAFAQSNTAPKRNAGILCYGELLSAAIVHAQFNDSRLIDARDIIITDNNYLHARVCFEPTHKRIQSILKTSEGITIVPGFIGSTANGETTTLGRGGSDYTASILASALQASCIEIWTNVDGFLTADPRKVSKAFAIKSLSYAEAMELSHFGAKVIYTPTIQPVLTKKIPIVIKNTFNHEAPGTTISSMPDTDINSSPIKGVSSIDDIDLITLQGAGMVGVRGTSSRLFKALADADVNIILITQASSEYSITFAISPVDTEKAVRSIENAFETEIHVDEQINILVEKDLSVIAIVGEQMKNTPGISATLFGALGRNGISAIATAQGSSELNISVVISNKSLKKALNVIHEAFFLSHYKELHLFVVGAGTVGGSLLSQIKQQRKHLLEEHNVMVNVVGIARTKKMALNPEGIDLDNYMTEIEHGTPTDLNKFIGAIPELNLRNSVFVDCTADDKVADLYSKVLNSFASVVTANKVACSSEYELYKKLKKTALQHNVKFMYETNVGAGLPIINTINDLSRSGDKILKLEAVLSGTLNFLFNTLSEEIPLSKAILLAKEKGYSEPDPRIDLSGIDVVRKLIILAREAGYALEQKDVEIEPFLPEECFEGSLEDFWQKVKNYDHDFEEKRKILTQKGLKWRFIASLNDGKAKVSLQTVGMLHPAYPLEGSNNILLLTTERYHKAPMVIRGYGAGADVTAAGVFADIIRVANV